MATPEALPSGIAFRPPAYGDPVSPEVLGLLVIEDEQIVKLIRLGLLDAIEYDELPPGDVLLALNKKD